VCAGFCLLCSAQAFHALEAMASVPWALQPLCNAPGLLDNLLDAEAADQDEAEDRQWR